MCNACVIEGVKEQMISRRSLFAGVALAVAATPAAAAVPAKPHDLTHELHADFPTYFGGQQFFMDRKFSFAENGFNLFELRLSEHTGTHMDAPLHFSADGLSVAEVPVENLILPLAVIDIRERAAANPDAQVTPEDIKAWSAKHGPLPRGCCVAMNSGWDSHVATPKFRNADDKKVMHFPGFHADATRLLLEDGNAVGIAVDTLSLDHGPSPDFAAHGVWLPTGRWGLEAVANLSGLPESGATLIVGAPKIRGGTGGPCRVFALA